MVRKYRITKTKRIRKKRNRFTRKRKKLNISILGGGGGSSSLISALKGLVLKKKINTLTSIVSNSDDGGSTGKLRETYDTIAWGDITKNLLAMVDKPTNFSRALKCRFNEGDFKGHTFRNIIGVALSRLNNCDDICALDEMSRLLKINRNLKVIPITKKSSILKFTSNKGFKKTKDAKKNVKQLIGQRNISLFPIQNITKSIDDYNIEIIDRNKKASLNPDAIKYLKRSDVIVISPGHTHGTTLSTLAVKNIHKYLKNKIVIYMIPFFNRTSIKHTVGWKTSNYIKLYNKYIKREPDIVIANTNYSKHVSGHTWVENDVLNNDKYTIIANDLLSTKSKNSKSYCPKPKTDKIVRAPLGFDNKKVLNIFKKHIL